MFYEPFVSRFPDIGYAEMRAVRINGRRDLPDGNYGFLELFCTDRTCDCRRVITHALEEGTAGEVWATINYGWETKAFYESWYRSKQDVVELVGASLEPLGKQSRYAQTLLQLFEHMLGERGYAKRLQRHYEIFKVAQNGNQPAQGSGKRPTRK
jgi:hypothetical protein